MYQILYGIFTLIFIAGSDLCWAYITYIEPRTPLKGTVPAPGSPWPMPQLWQNSSQVFSLHPKHFAMYSVLKYCDVIDEALIRYSSITFLGMRSRRRTSTFYRHVHELRVVVWNKECSAYPTVDNDESYEVEITQKTSSVSAQTVWGALKGLETFSQLVYQDENGEFLINKTYIQDRPRFRHRGILLDTARHYIPVPLILKNLDAMSYNKFNVFHWHIVDDQSFPYESRTFPQISQMGAYSSRFTYSQADVNKVIEYARLRGIRVIPEFDTPGHTMSWGKAFPYLLTPCYVDGEPGRANYTEHHTHEVFNPINEETYQFLQEFFSEVLQTFSDPYIHLGMDEVYYACWKSNPHIKEFMRQKGFAADEFYKLEQHYIERLMEIITKLGGSYIIWQDPIENGALPKRDTLVQIWKDTSLWDIYDSWQNYSSMVASKGYKMILSSCWYLNYVNYGPDWESLYLCEPGNFTDDTEIEELMIGGEACMWSEYVDATNFMSRLWPRASAVAERLWSNRDINNVDDAQFRLDQQRCRLLRRGIPAQPIMNGYCEEVDYEETLAMAWSSAALRCPYSPHLPLILLYIYTISIEFI